MFTNCYEAYCEFREMDMREDRELVEKFNLSSPSLVEINFNHIVIGSDETGTGEIFKPLVVTAAYIKDIDEMMKYMRMGVTDSKNIEGKVEGIAHAITGINTFEDIRDAAYSETVISNEDALYAIRVITNEELNAKCVDGDIDGVKESLLKEAHFEVLKYLYDRHPGATVVVDDFTDNKKVEKIKDELSVDIPRENIFLTTKGDAKIMAVALGSVISSHISNIGLEDAKMEYKKILKDDADYNIELPAGSPDAEELIPILKQIKPECLEEFMNKYAKKYYKNVISAMK